MRASVLSVLSLGLVVATAAPAYAHHVVWLDFSDFDLDAFPTVNDVTPGAAEVETTKNLIVRNIVQDYAPFDIYFSLEQPSIGRYTRLRILGRTVAGLYGTSGGCVTISCGGIDSWEQAVSGAEVYAGTFETMRSMSSRSERQAPRIARAISHTASHELGHVLGLWHCNALDDRAWNCADNGNASTSADQNISYHVMTTSSLGITEEERASLDRFFSVRSSRRSLFQDLQTRNHWSKLPNINGGAAWDDAVYGEVLVPGVTWAANLSASNAYRPTSSSLGDLGQKADLFMTADMTGDGRDDLVFGKIISSGRVEWWVAPSNGTTFDAATQWTADSGSPGAIYRLGDVTGDGRDDLFFGEPLSSTTVQWRMRASTGSGLGPTQVLIGDAGDEGDLFLVGDVDGDGRTDLVTKYDSGTEVFLSSGNTFVFAEDDGIQSFFPDYVMVQDVTGDGRADLVVGHVLSDTAIRYTVRVSDACAGSDCFDNGVVWIEDAGNSGDAIRMGDGDGDDRLDLVAVRPQGVLSRTAIPDLSSVHWYSARSNGFRFETGTLWSADASSDGDLVP